MATKLLTPLGGGVTLEAANTATDKTLTLPADNGTVVYANSSGNVGIGTSSPVTKLTMAGNISFSGNQALNWNMYSNAGDKYIANGYAAQFYYDPSAGTLRYLNAGNNVSGAGASASLTDRFAIDSSGNLQFNSGYGSVATAYGCRAWVNFNGTGTVAIRASGNVSSITDGGTGIFTLNFTSALVDGNYCPSFMCARSGYSASEIIAAITAAPTTTTLRIKVSNGGATSLDPEVCTIQIVR